MDRSLYHLFSQLKKPSICVCGDFMLDTYVKGRVSRVSPEGPIPVLHVDEKHHRPGGAGSVAAMLCALESEVFCVGLRGNDWAGEEMGRQLRNAGCHLDGLLPVEDRPTTLKTRYMGYVQSAGRGIQQIVRVDEESIEPVDALTAEKIAGSISGKLESVDLVLLQDMAKGMLPPELIQRIIRICRKKNKPVIIDPSIKQDYQAYKHAACILPNRVETENAVSGKLTRESEYAEAANQLLETLDLDFCVITLDREGMFFASRDGLSSLVPTTPRSVSDVTGAGDMVAAMLALALAGGMQLKDAVRLANAAAGLEVSRQGATPIAKTVIEQELRACEEPAASKILSENDIEDVIAPLRRRGETIAFTNGVFDLLHLGHIELIRFASEQADRLIVGMNSDSSVRSYKGEARPVTPEKIRARTLAAMPNVDYVVIFEDPSVYSLIERIAPDVLIKGGDYSNKKEVVGWEVVEDRGGRVLRAPHVEGFSTTDIINKIRGAADEE